MNKKIKNLITIIILAVIIVAGLANVRFTSVKEHDEEKASIRNELLQQESTKQAEENIVAAEETSITATQSTEAVAESTEVVTKSTEAMAESTAPQEMITCKILISCKNLYDNLDALSDAALREYVPENGEILKEVSISLPKGTNCYEALNLACKAFDIHLESKYTAIYNSCYIQGIGYIYEKSAGDLSGWIYKVNGRTMSVGASGCILNEADVLGWYYTLDGGKDVS